MNIALITAAGVGTRTKQIVPKQFLNVFDKPVIIYTMECFQNHPEIDAIYVACLAGWEGFMDLYAQQFGITKLKKIVKGGKTGQESIELVLDEIAKDLCAFFHQESVMITVTRLREYYYVKETVNGGL